jgi:hypothetical protein
MTQKQRKSSAIDRNDLQLIKNKLEEYTKDIQLKIKTLELANTKLHEENQEQNQKITFLQTQSDLFRQQTLQNVMEISGLAIPNSAICSNDGLTQQVHKYLVDAGFVYLHNDVINIRRCVRNYGSFSKEIILVTFINEYAKLNLMKQRCNKAPIYLNHSITKSTRNILSEAKRKVRAKEITSAWLAHGFVYIKLNDDKRIKIVSVDQLVQINSNNQLVTRQPKTPQLQTRSVKTENPLQEESPKWIIESPATTSQNIVHTPRINKNKIIHKKKIIEKHLDSDSSELDEEEIRKAFERHYEKITLEIRSAMEGISQDFSEIAKQAIDQANQR